jgi:hypothetical protein
VLLDDTIAACDQPPPIATSVSALGPATKAGVLRKRNAIIDSLMEQQMTDPQAIYRHLQEHHPEQLYKNKRSKTFISIQSMVRRHPRLNSLSRTRKDA